jgi:alkylation response protein AidB-like acyl-CoA dehydrogenase
MDLTPTEEQEQIRAAAREFLQGECSPAHVRSMEDDERGYSPEVWAQMAELGWLGWVFPEEHGGGGASFLDLCLLVEEQGRSLLPSPFLPTVVLAGQAIARFGSDSLRAEHLPAIASGEQVMGVARTGPAASWDTGDVGVVFDHQGADYVLEGAATLVEYANVADVLVVLARHGDALEAFLVPGDATGVIVEPLRTVAVDHRHCVSFDGVRVSEDAVLGEPGGGRTIAEAIARWGTAARCADMVGAAQQVLEMTVAYAKERVAFDQPIGSFQAIQHHCAEMAVDLLGARLVTWEAIWRLSEGLDAEEALSVAKTWASDAVPRVCARGHQIHGAIGFTREHELHLYMRHVRAAELDFGDAAWHRERVAQTLGL